MDAKTAQSVFGGAPKKRSLKEEESYKSTNESLVKKILLYKQQLAERSKTIEKLREENLVLRQRNQELADGTDERRIEIIVEQRVQKRLAHAAVLNKKLVQILLQTGSEMEGVFEGIDMKQSGLNTRRMPKVKSNMGKVDESPIRRVPRDDQDDDNMENMETDSNPTTSSCSSQNLENGTPRKRNTNGRGRRSELFQDFGSLPVDETITEEKVPGACGPKRVPMLIAPVATPSAAVPVKKPPVSARRRKSVDAFKKPSTPAPIAQPGTDITDTFQVRRQRSAKMNIKTLKEPSLGGKLRRPGKHDEPMPYIDTFF